MSRSSGRIARPALIAQAAAGGVLCLRPAAAARVLDAPPVRSRPILRVLGARHLLEALAILARPTRGVVAAGIVVDATHVLSCLLFGAVSAEHRQPALRDAALQSATLLATCLALPEKQ